jgi:4-amino-4-deoxy-L-arabinose transferase-like glycosyltransferase
MRHGEGLPGSASVPGRLDPKIAAGLVLVVLLGAWVRLSGLDLMSISHPEMYVPGLPLPAGLSEPQPRLTLAKTLSGTFSADTHPPAYYVLMWAWTKLFGAGLAAIRLPSALFGILSIPLLYWTGSLIGQRKAGLLAAGLLAFSGYHVFWSKVARMYSLTCFLGLLATVLLLLLVRSERRRPLLEAGYAAVILLGLASHIFFWGIFATHLVWVLVNARSSCRELPAIARIQILALIAGSPLIAFAAYQTGNQLAIMSRHVLPFIRGFVTFSFLYPPEGISDLFVRASAAEPVVHQLATLPAVALVLFGVSVLLVAAGLKSTVTEAPQFAPAARGSFRKFWLGVALLATAGIWLFVATAQVFAKPEPYPTLRLTKALSVLPLLLAGLAIALDSLWRRLPGWGRPLWHNRLFVGTQAIVPLLAVVPFGIIAFISVFKPMLNQRGLLPVAPYLLLLLAIGAMSLVRSRGALGAALAFLGVVHAGSVASYNIRSVDPTDFRDFAAKLVPEIGKDDLVFFQRSWYATPILHYLSADRYHLVAEGYSEARKEGGGARVWVLQFDRADFSDEIRQAVAGLERLRTVESGFARADLYARRAQASVPPAAARAPGR